VPAAAKAETALRLAVRSALSRDTAALITALSGTCFIELREALSKARAAASHAVTEPRLRPPEFSALEAGSTKVQADELRRVLAWAAKRKFDKGGGAGGRGAEVPDGEDDEEAAVGRCRLTPC